MDKRLVEALKILQSKDESHYLETAVRVLLPEQMERFLDEYLEDIYPESAGKKMDSAKIMMAREVVIAALAFHNQKVCGKYRLAWLAAVDKLFEKNGFAPYRDPKQSRVGGAAWNGHDSHNNKVDCAADQFNKDWGCWL